MRIWHETTAICTVHEKKHFLAKSMSAQTLNVNVSTLLRTECGVLVDVARSSVVRYLKLERR